MREIVCCLGISAVQSHGAVSALVGGIPPLDLPVKRAEQRSQPGGNPARLFERQRS